MPTISLHMIVRDVAPYIHRCLDSIVPFVDDVVIVDTGSKDDTKNVIRRIVPSTLLQLLSFNETTHPKAFLRDAAESLSLAHTYLRAAGGHEASAFLVDMAVLCHDLAHDLETTRSSL